MSTLSEYIKTQPERPMREWADQFGISRPHLIALMAGERAPSIKVARQIEQVRSGRYISSRAQSRFSLRHPVSSP